MAWICGGEEEVEGGAAESARGMGRHARTSGTVRHVGTAQQPVGQGGYLALLLHRLSTSSRLPAAHMVLHTTQHHHRTQPPTQSRSGLCTRKAATAGHCSTHIPHYRTIALHTCLLTTSYVCRNLLRVRTACSTTRQSNWSTVPYSWRPAAPSSATASAWCTRQRVGVVQLRCRTAGTGCLDVRKVWMYGLCTAAGGVARP